MGRGAGRHRDSLHSLSPCVVARRRHNGFTHGQASSLYHLPSLDMSDLPEPAPVPREGQPDPKLTREEFERRYRRSFVDPAFDAHRDAIDQLAAIAWEAYQEGRMATHTHKAVHGIADPDNELSVGCRPARASIHTAHTLLPGHDR